MHFLLFYEKAAGFAEKQVPHVAPHLDHVMKAASDGTLLLAGSLSNPDDGAALLLFAAADEAEAFAKADPYVIHGIISSWRIRPWDLVVGGERVSPRT